MKGPLSPAARTQVVAHIERYLGTIQGGGKVGSGVQLVETDLPSIRNTAAWSTLGLSDHPLDGRGREMRMELIMLARRGKELARVAPGILAGFTGAVLESHRAPLRGETVRCPTGDNPPALYVSAPVHLPEEFHVVDVEVANVIFAWLVPITNEEADAIYHHGWQAFEAALLREDPDLLELRTTSVAGLHPKS